jgi:hypothetical protein
MMISLRIEALMPLMHGNLTSTNSPSIVTKIKTKSISGNFRGHPSMCDQKSIAGAIGTLTALLWVNIAYSQTPTTATEPAQDASAYCQAAAAAFREGAGEAEYAKVNEKCRPGDTIGFNATARSSVLQVARLCDFTKQVVNMGSEIVCVFLDVRGVRK